MINDERPPEITPETRLRRLTVHVLLLLVPLLAAVLLFACGGPWGHSGKLSPVGGRQTPRGAEPTFG